ATTSTRGHIKEQRALGRQQRAMLVYVARGRFFGRNTRRRPRRHAMLTAKDPTCAPRAADTRGAGTPRGNHCRARDRATDYEHHGGSRGSHVLRIIAAPAGRGGRETCKS